MKKIMMVVAMVGVTGMLSGCAVMDAGGCALDIAFLPVDCVWGSQCDPC